MTQRHLLHDVDLDALRAVCVVCGPVDVAWRWHGSRVGHKKRPCCGNKRREERLKHRQRYDMAGYVPGPHGLKPAEREAFIGDKPCAVCGSFERLVVDHSYITGEVRGVLCSNCNCGLGFFGDSPERLEAAAQYLRTRQRPHI